jgi:hypothetical protein
MFVTLFFFGFFMCFLVTEWHGGSNEENVV